MSNKGNPKIPQSVMMEVWDTFGIISKRSQGEKENRLQVLSAKYESLYNKNDKSLLDLYEWVKILFNDLSLFGIIYNNQDQNIGLMASDFSKGNVSRDVWVLDSGCSRHMTENLSMLTDFKEKAGPIITFGDNGKGRTLGYGKAIYGNVILEGVALVDGLGYNLLSISQFCDKGYEARFNGKVCLFTYKDIKFLALNGIRYGDVYRAEFDGSSRTEVSCFLSKASNDMSWLWHKRLSHLNFNSLNELARKDLVIGLPNVEFSQDGLCAACQKGKQK